MELLLQLIFIISTTFIIIYIAERCIDSHKDNKRGQAITYAILAIISTSALIIHCIEIYNFYQTP